MGESFSFTVTYNNKARNFEGLFQPYGYSYRISVDIDNATIFFIFPSRFFECSSAYRIYG